MLRLSSSLFKNALLLVGAFFLVCAGQSCRRESAPTAKWNLSPVEASEAGETERAADLEGESAPALSPNHEEVRFLSYNLKNYLTMRRGKEYLPKPEDEIKAVVGVISRQKPDILGLCEIGTVADLEDLQKRLKAVGVDLPHFEHTGGRNKTRHLGLLSRFPITATDSQNKSNYEMEGKTWTISRGILDVTLDVNGSPLRLLGVHLKSKREIDYADQELIRQNEARLVRNHADRILEQALGTQLLVYGDFNDTISSRTLSIAKGRSNGKTHLADFYFKDERGELWTHFWDYQDVYSRFDYVLFSKSLRSKLNGKASYIVDDPSWKKASDHRALLLVLKP